MAKYIIIDQNYNRFQNNKFQCGKLHELLDGNGPVLLILYNPYNNIY